MSNMYDLLVRAYGRLVIFKRRTIEEVPEQYREDVKKWLEAQNRE